MDIQDKIDNYFKLNNDERDKLIEDIFNTYFQRYVDTIDNETIIQTLDRLLFNFANQQHISEQRGDYEHAEIYKQLIRVSSDIKNQLINEDELL